MHKEPKMPYLHQLLTPLSHHQRCDQSKVVTGLVCVKKIVSVFFFVISFGWGNAQATEIVDVMVIYSHAAGSKVNESNIEHSIINTNKVFRNSGISTRLRLVYSASVNFQEADFVDSDEALLVMESKTDGILDEIHALRDKNGADLVILIVDAIGLWDGWTRGDANVLYRNDPKLSEYAPFALVDWEALDANAFSHEIAHTMGIHHDWYVSSHKKVPYPYARGHVNIQEGWRTLMAYKNECIDHGTECSRIPFFSNPDIKYNGVPTGIPVSTNTSCQNGMTANLPCDANGALALMQTSSTVAGFREEFWETLIKPATLYSGNETVLTTFSPEFTWKHNPLASHYGLMVGLSPDGSKLAFMGEGENVLVYEHYNAADICVGEVCKVAPRMSNSNGHHYWSTSATNINVQILFSYL
jgi:Metallo-peptidase family M12B Reprolysin-like